MSLNDKRNVYINNIKLCENNCDLKKIIDKEYNYKEQKALCFCNLKSKFSLDSDLKKKENVKPVYIPNFKVITCIKESFNNESLIPNPNFWIFLIIMIFQIYMLLNAFCKGKKQIFKRLKIKEETIKNNIEGNNIIHNNPPKKGKGSLKNYIKSHKNHLNISKGEEGDSSNNQYDKNQYNYNYDSSLISRSNQSKSIQKDSPKEENNMENIEKSSQKKNPEENESNNAISYIKCTNNQAQNNNDFISNSEDIRKMFKIQSGKRREKVSSKNNSAKSNNLIENSELNNDKNNQKFSKIDNNKNVINNNFNNNIDIKDISDKSEIMEMSNVNNDNNNFNIELNKINNNTNPTIFAKPIKLKSKKNPIGNRNRNIRVGISDFNSSNENISKEVLSGSLNLKNNNNIEYIKPNQQYNNLTIEKSEHNNDFKEISINNSININILEEKSEYDFKIIENKPLKIENNFFFLFL